MYPVPEDLTIAAGAITPTREWHRIDTEAQAASDDLDTISGGFLGRHAYLLPLSDARTVVVRHGAGNILCPSAQNLSLAEDDDYVELLCIGTNWIATSWKTQATGGGGLGAALASTAAGLGAALVGIEAGTLPGNPATAQAALLNALGTGGTITDQIFTAATGLVIAAGSITAVQGVHTVTGEGAADDDLTTIVNGATAEEMILIRPGDAAQTIRLVHGIGANLIATPNGVPILLAEVTDWALLMRSATQWTVVGSSVLNTPTSLTLAAGAAAVTGVPVHTIIGEGSNPDVLTTLTGGVVGQHLVIRTADAADPITITHGVGANLIATPGGLPIVLTALTDWAKLFHNGTQWSVIATNVLNTPTELTIAAGVIAFALPHHTVDTEADAATDDLTTITGGSIGQYLLLRAINAARTVRLIHGIGANLINLNGRMTVALAEATDWALLVHDGTQWSVVGATELNPWLVIDPGNGGAIPVDKSGVCAMTSVGADTRTLAAPTTLGQRLTLVHDTDAGSVTVTCATGLSFAADTVLVFTGLGFADLVAISIGGALRWRVTSVGLTNVNAVEADPNINA